MNILINADISWNAKFIIMKGICLFFIEVILTINIHAQDLDTIFFNKNYTSVDKSQWGAAPLYKLTNDTILYRSKAYKIIIPNNIDTSELAFCFEYFTGWEDMPIPQIPVFLISEFKGSQSNIYIDYNQNLDFSDDGVPLLLNSLNDSVTISLPNSNNHAAIFNLNLKFVDFGTAEIQERMESFYKNHKNGKGNVLLESKYWFSVVRYNSLITETMLNGDSIKIGIRDYDCNGLFNDPRDRIMIGNYSTGFISDLKSKGSYVYEDTTIVKINNNFYEVENIDAAGKYIVLKSTNLRSNRLEVGDTIPNLYITLMDGSIEQLHNVLDSNKFNLIDIWGTWCKGCLLQTSELIRLDSAFSSILNIVALNFGDSEEGLKAHLSKYNITWLNGYSNKEMRDIFLVDSYPYLLLLDKNRRIITMQARINEVEELISKD